MTWEEDRAHDRRRTDEPPTSSRSATIHDIGARGKIEQHLQVSSCEGRRHSSFRDLHCRRQGICHRAATPDPLILFLRHFSMVDWPTMAVDGDREVGLGSGTEAEKQLPLLRKAAGSQLIQS